MGRFKDWYTEIAMASDGTTNNASTQTSQATAQVAQQWMSNPKNSSFQSQVIAKKNNPSAVAPDILKAGAEAVKTAPPAIGSQTTPPMVANFMQTQLGLPSVVQAPKPNALVSKMRKR